MSQFDLETEIDASNGMISRIEKGIVNPTKETIFKIAEALDLNKSEISYLLGLELIEFPQKDIQSAKSTVNQFFEKPTTTAYLLDNRDRFHYFSKGFRILMSVMNLKSDNFIGISVDEALFDYKYGLRQLVPKDKFRDTAISVLARWINEKEYILNEDWMQDMVIKLSSYEDFNEIWEYINNNNIEVYSEDARSIEFKFLTTVFKFNYSLIPLNSDDRFRIVDYKFSVGKSEASSFLK